MMPNSYPAAPRLDIVDTLHDHEVHDPYRWLEDPHSPQVEAWQAAQDELYNGFVTDLSGRDKLAARLAELMAAGEVTAPVWRSTRQFYTRREPGQEHAVLYTASDAGGERKLVDPMQIDPAGVTTLDSWDPDHDGRLLAYQLSEGGDEESQLRVMDVATGEVVDGPIDRCRYTSVAWLPGGDAFYYVRRLPPNDVPAGEDQFHRRVYLHRVGTSADEDLMIFGAGREKTNYYSVSVNRDGRWLIVSAAAGTAPRNDVWIADLHASDASAPALSVVQEGVDARTWPVPGRDGLVYMLTDRAAPRRRIVVADPDDDKFPSAESWHELIDQDDHAVIEDFAILDGDDLGEPQIVVARRRHAISELTVHHLTSGKQLNAVELPGLGSVDSLHERPEGGHQAWFAYADYAHPGRVLHYDAVTSGTDVWSKPPGAIEVPAITTRQVAYESADGTTIRMVVISAGAEADDGQADNHVPRSARPAILYGYGGFNVSLTPAFAASILAWVEAGGLYAIAGLRGGSEEGEQWHRAGMREHKQNVFDDFHAAAEKLIKDGWTTADQLAVWGGSNGGLLVGASVTQRPELKAAAVCSAPLLDMVRYELFGLGETWNDEFGTAAKPDELEWLLSYSPYHHVRPGVRYPAVLFAAFDGDTRVDPLHARKMCAAMQYATAAPPEQRPILLRREANVGHGQRAISRTVGMTAEMLAFVAAQTGLEI